MEECRHLEGDTGGPCAPAPLAKRGGDAVRVPLDEVLLAAETRGIEVLALDEALNSLARIDSRKSRVVGIALFRRIEHRGDRGGPTYFRRYGQAPLEDG